MSSLRLRVPSCDSWILKFTDSKLHAGKQNAIIYTVTEVTISSQLFFLIIEMCRDMDARRDELRRSNNKLKSNNDEVIEQIEIHEETKVCIEKEMAEECSVSTEMLHTIETVNDRIEEISAAQEAEILKLDSIIQSSTIQLQKNIDANSRRIVS